jgi:predicted methyltransferase
MTIVEIDPGANGWWTGILAPYAHATDGRYVAALMVEAGVIGADNFEAARAAFLKGVADKAIFGDAEAVDFGPSNKDAIPAGSADFVLAARAFHNWAREGDATDAYLAAFFRMLKPGGILAVEQHRAPEGADPRAGTGYVPESYVIDAALRAGLMLEARSEINANPKDTKDHPFGVWTLPPTRRSAPAGQPVDPNFDHTKYDAIGESDRMTLKFRKPE